MSIWRIGIKSYKYAFSYFLRLRDIRASFVSFTREEISFPGSFRNIFM